MSDFIKKGFLISSNSVAIQFMRSIFTGGLASLVDISIFSICVDVLTIHHLISNTLSFTVGMIVNYYICREWVFNKKATNQRRDFFYSF